MSCRIRVGCRSYCCVVDLSCFAKGLLIQFVKCSILADFDPANSRVPETISFGGVTVTNENTANAFTVEFLAITVCIMDI